MRFWILIAASTALALPVGANAATVTALTGDNTLVHVDSETRKAMKTVKVTGIDERLVGIDVRPADGMLYGLLADGTVVTIDPASGKATRKSKLDTMLPSGVTGAVDFNPVADRLRVIGADGTNLRANVDDGKVMTDGKLKFADADMHKGEMPNIVAGAYSNSMKGAKETALYDIDATIMGLIKQAPPNDGVLNAVGKLGMSKSDEIVFDIVSDGSGGNQAWLLSGGMLYKVDLSTGKAAEAGRISGFDGKVRDIAILPAM
jgi:hypothetical protein